MWYYGTSRHQILNLMLFSYCFAEEKNAVHVITAHCPVLRILPFIPYTINDFSDLQDNAQRFASVVSRNAATEGTLRTLMQESSRVATKWAKVKLATTKQKMIRISILMMIAPKMWTFNQTKTGSHSRLKTLTLISKFIILCWVFTEVLSR